MQAVNWDEVRNRTVALYARWPGYGRQYLPEVLSEKQVHQAEAQFGVEFPEDYRQYLLRVSAGGRVRKLQFDGSRWDWDGASYKCHDKLHVPFPDHDSALAATEEAWANKPERENYISDEAYQTAHGAWFETADALEVARATGAVFLNDDGCGYYTLLVVSGPMRGTMWFDGRAATERLNPLLNDDRQPATFAEWYQDWLAHEESLRTATTEQRRAALRKWSAGVGTPIWYRWFDS